MAQAYKNKTMKKYTFTALVLMLAFTALAQESKSEKFKARDRKIIVFTTAENTDLRLKQTDNFEFKSSKQPLETEASVFVNPENFSKFYGYWRCNY